MSITVIYSKEETDHSFSFTKNKFQLISLFFAALLIASIWFIQAYYQKQLNQFKTAMVHNSDISKYHYLQLIQAENDHKLLVLANQMGSLQARMNRLNALGKRVVEKSNLPAIEFEFDLPLPIGGPSVQETNSETKFKGLLNYIENIDLYLKKREEQLDRLEITLNDRHLIDQLYISGRPIKGKGSWISSPFGLRKDPFTGHLTQHKGVDIAGFSGMPIVSTAAGVVTSSGKKGGYGLMVEVTHGNGLTTRYGHAQLLNVAVGDIVSKGQQIAVMGSTGRSTGPHVHYEVLKNGKQINPGYYIQRKSS